MVYSKGDNIYKYALEDKIGGGNFGEVWTATDLALKTRIAIKLLDKTQYTIDERLLEAQIGNRLQHPNVVNIKGADVIDVAGSPVVAISMPYYSNGSVLSKINSLNFLNLKEAIKCLIDVLRGLEYLHENGYYHCDIKPNNILVGDHSEYILTDYGITCYSPNFQAVTPKQSYLPHISPETISKNIYDARTDIYQLGLTAFRLINGISEIRDEFDKNRTTFSNKVLNGKLIIPNKYKPYVPQIIRRIINKATAVDPDERFQTPLEMRRALERIQIIGDCTGDSSGNLILIKGNYTYRYEIGVVQKNHYTLATYKCNIKSGRETRYSKYCISNLSQKELQKSVQSFCLDIISG
jgi:serine/threonine protein kinase